MNNKSAEIKRYLNVIKRASAYIESLLENDDDGLLEQMINVPKDSPKIVQEIAPPPPIIIEPKFVPPEQSKAHEEARKKHVADLLAIDCWPESILSSIANKKPSDQDQMHRANAVLDTMLDRSVDGLKFLDYGCGEGWMAQEICKRGVAESWAYDHQANARWSSLNGVKAISSRDQFPKTNNYFDVIMLYDVLDHCEDPVELMSHVKSCISHTGVVYVRCHPWTSKHASHLFKHGLNKAYLHLFLNWSELKEIIKEDPLFTRPEKNAIEAYHWWFKDFEIKRERFIDEPVSQFFHVPAFKELLASEQQIPLSEIDKFLKLMEIQFVNYCLVPKK